MMLDAEKRNLDGERKAYPETDCEHGRYTSERRTHSSVESAKSITSQYTPRYRADTMEKDAPFETITSESLFYDIESSSVLTRGGSL